MAKNPLGRGEGGEVFVVAVEGLAGVVETRDVACNRVVTVLIGRVMSWVRVPASMPTKRVALEGMLLVEMPVYLIDVVVTGITTTESEDIDSKKRS